MRLEAKKMAREMDEYKTDVANEMLRKAMQQNDEKENAEKQEKGRQNQLVRT